MDKIRIAIAGTGGMARERAKALHQSKQATVCGIYSRKIENTGEFCDLTGAEGFADYGRMLECADAVVICLPNFLHTEYALEALAAGKHVLVEYPLCTQHSDISRLQNAALKAGTVLMVGNTIIHEEMFRYLTKHKDRLGKILSASSRVALYSKPLQDAWYMDKTCYGGLFTAFHYHHIEYYRHLLGAVESVVANEESVAESAEPHRNSITGGSLVMQHKGGGTSCIQWYLSRYGDSLPRGMWINGTRGSVTVVSHEENKSLVLWGQGKDGSSEVLNDSWGIPGSTNDFIQAILGNMDHRVRLKSDISTLRVGQSADESAKQQQKLRVEYYE